MVYVVSKVELRYRQSTFVVITAAQLVHVPARACAWLMSECAAGMTEAKAEEGSSPHHLTTSPCLSAS